VGADDIGLPVPPGPVGEGSAAGDALLPPELDLRAVREAAERQAIIAALARTNSNIAKASELLGVSRPTLYDLMHKLAIK
jgi:two-component system NtrC family response regulator